MFPNIWLSKVPFYQAFLGPGCIFSMILDWISHNEIEVRNIHYSSKHYPLNIWENLIIEWSFIICPWIKTQNSWVKYFYGEFPSSSDILTLSLLMTKASLLESRVSFDNNLTFFPLMSVRDISSSSQSSTYGQVTLSDSYWFLFSRKLADFLLVNFLCKRVNKTH